MTLIKAEHNDKNSDNIKQTNERILRAEDIIPGSLKRNSQISAHEHTNTEQASNIPKFDLADEIMAKHREITAIKRKGPGKKADAQHLQPFDKPMAMSSVEPQQTKPTVATIEQPTMPLSQQQIIADIVERDIEKLCSTYITN